MIFDLDKEPTTEAEKSKVKWPKLHEHKTSELPYLGEIILCIVQLQRQAHTYGVTHVAEVARMTIHGFLHVWGYDHIKVEDARIMMPLQDKILEKFLK